MALNNEAKIGNLKRSIDLYCKNYLVTAEALNVDFEGVPFDDSKAGVVSWVQPRILSPIPLAFYPGGGNGVYAEQVSVTLQFNIFSKKSGTTMSSPHYDIRDAVAGHFKVGQNIGLMEATGETTLAIMRVREINADQPMPESNELLHYLYSVEIGFTRRTNKA